MEHTMNRHMFFTFVLCLALSACASADPPLPIDRPAVRDADESYDVIDTTDIADQSVDASSADTTLFDASYLDIRLHDTDHSDIDLDTTVEPNDDVQSERDADVSVLNDIREDSLDASDINTDTPIDIAADSSTYEGDGDHSLDAEDTSCAFPNLCGGCSPLSQEPGIACGPCSEGVIKCAGSNEVICDNARPLESLNACGGCTILDQQPYQPCGTCESGLTRCTDENTVVCVGDLSEDALNECGGCEILDHNIGDPCGPCDMDHYICLGETLVCDGSTHGCCDTDDDCPANHVCNAEQCTPEGYIRVESGSFLMGSPTTEPGRHGNEHLHSVTLTTDFYMASAEVTAEQWQEIFDSLPGGYTGCDNCPITHVTWAEAIEYANRRSIEAGLLPCYELTSCTGRIGRGYAGTSSDNYGCNRVSVLVPDGNPYLCEGYRLPTEAEWEYATRAGTQTTWFCGNDESCLSEIAWYGRSSAVPLPYSGVKEPNAFGLYDTLGSVNEWTWDTYQPYSTAPITDPYRSGNSNHAVRGGSLVYDASRCRSAFRESILDRTRSNHLGFRLVRSIVD